MQNYFSWFLSSNNNKTKSKNFYFANCNSRYFLDSVGKFLNKCLLNISCGSVSMDTTQ